MKRNYPLNESGHLLGLIAEFGTCSASTLSLIQGRPLKRIHESIAILAERGLITRLSTSVAGKPALHVQLAASARARTIASKALNIALDDLPKRGFPITQLVHEDECAKLHYRLKMRYPTAKIVRDWNMHRQVPVSVIPNNLHRDRLIPDIMLGIPRDSEGEAHTWIGIEYDRTRKKISRLHEKLHLYARESQISGLLYIVPDQALMRELRDYFRKSVVAQSPRVRPTKEVFLARLLAGEHDKNLRDLTVKCESRDTDFETWVTWIAKPAPKNPDSNPPESLGHFPSDSILTEKT